MLMSHIYLFMVGFQSITQVSSMQHGHTNILLILQSRGQHMLDSLIVHNKISRKQKVLGHQTVNRFLTILDRE